MAVPLSKWRGVRGEVEKPKIKIMDSMGTEIIKSYTIYSAKAKLNKPISDATHTLTEISFLVLRI